MSLCLYVCMCMCVCVCVCVLCVCVCVCVYVCMCFRRYTHTLLEVLIIILFHFNINTHVDLAKIKFVSKISYVTPIVEAGLSPKEKPLKHSRGRNFALIVSKLGTKVDLV